MTRTTLVPRWAARSSAVVMAACLAAITLGPLGALAAKADRHSWKGAESFTPVQVGPNPSRCGPFPQNLEARFAGSGIDTNGGPFSVTASGCLDTVANVLSSLEATDTYLDTGDAVLIAPGDVALTVDPTTCVATNRQPVHFDVAGGTGRYAGARGDGTYDLAFTLPSCAGAQQSVYVWFRGRLIPTDR